MNTTADSLSTDEVLDLLSSGRRRFVIQYLAEEDRTDLTQLARETAAWEHGVPPSAITDDGRRRTYISLYQTHLPRLEEANVITYDEDERTVELAENAQTLRESLPGQHREPRWATYYLVVGAFALVGLFVSPASPTIVAVGLALAVIFLAIGQHLGERQRAESTLHSLVD